MINRIVRFASMILGAMAGAELYGQMPFFDFYAIFLFIIFGAILGYLAGSVLGLIIKKNTSMIITRLENNSAAELFFGIIGLLIGIVIALILSMAIWRLPYVGPYLSVFAYILFGYLGMRLFTARRDELASFINILPGSSGSENILPSTRPKILDTSTIIDGRIADICKTGFIEGRLLVPKFVLKELQGIADSDDTIKRNRGRRGLDILYTLQNEKAISVEIYEKDYPDIVDVDAKIVKMAQEFGSSVITNDYNLNKVAELQKVQVLNINELSNALKPVVLPGEEMVVKVLKEGKEANQGVGYLDDGTMIVVEDGQEYVGKDVEVIVTSILQTPAGRMIFTRIEENGKVRS